ncbi:D-alanine--D-alanine ligase [Isoptericola haloaureus]|uniref:D-alanine--D-alanine ligase n=1 Tax=Isoptericola haloaureus TaxID=1542902 RepID=A0ABU7Z3W7_9MICO
MTAPASDASPVTPSSGTVGPVVILAGGLSHERDVSVRSGRRVAEALREAGVEVLVHDVDADLLRFLRDTDPALVWPVLHGASGEDGSLQDVLALAGVPTVGTGPRQSRQAWSKPVAKAELLQGGLSTPDYVTLPQALFRDLGAQTVLDMIVERLGLPLVVKPVQGGSALGVTRVDDAGRFPRAMVDCFSYGDTALIERAVDGIEVAVSVVDGPDGLEALPAVEIVTSGSYDYDARYNPGPVEYFTPARLDAEAGRKVAEVARRAHEILGLKHLSRTDIILDADGTPHVLEVNVSPGLTETSLLPQAAEAAGYPLSVLYRRIVEHALVAAR